MNGYFKRRKFGGIQGLLFLVSTEMYFGHITPQNDGRKYQKTRLLIIHACVCFVMETLDLVWSEICKSTLRSLKNPWNPALVLAKESFWRMSASLKGFLSLVFSMSWSFSKLNPLGLLKCKSSTENLLLCLLNTAIWIIPEENGSTIICFF